MSVGVLQTRDPGEMRSGAAAAGLATSWLGAVLLPWAIGRGLVLVAAQRAATVRGESLTAVFGAWDASWYAEIARSGYGFVTTRGETPYPFFPLLPWLLRAGELLGASPLATGMVLNHAVFLVALWGLYAIARAHGTAEEAALASWTLALYPGSTTLGLVYPCAIFLACAVWGFHALERRRDGLAATFAAAAAMVRPNGFVVAAAFAFAALRASRGIRRPLLVVLPALLCVVGWMAWLAVRTGDPLIFLHAKAGWHEVSLASLLDGSDPLPKLDLAPVLLGIGVLALTWRRLPAEWLVYTALAVLPSLALGILGMPRYVAACFPVFIGAGILLARVPLAGRVAILLTLAIALALLAQRILLLGHMP